MPNQTIGGWEKELREAISLASNHLSLYQLTIENGTKFGAMAKAGLLNEIDEGIAADMFDLTNDVTTSHGLHRYEVSNHAKYGFESKHNLNYWEYGDYIGIGPGAHGRYGDIKLMTVDIKQPELWMKAVIEYGNGVELKQLLTDEDMRVEKVMMGMRLSDGIDINLVSDYKDLVTDDLLETVDSKIRATQSGIKLLNSLITKII